MTPLESDSHNRPTFVRYQVVGLLTLAAAIAYLVRNAVGVAESTIREDMELTIRQSGWIMGVFFGSYAIFQIPGGWLAHRYGSRFAMAFFVAAWSIAALFIGIAPGLWMILIAQVIMGAAQAGAFPASCYSISHWIPLPRRTLACGVLTMGMQVGAISAGLLAGSLIDPDSWNWNWRLVFIAFSLPGFFWVAAFLSRFRDTPHDDPAVNESERELITEFQIVDTDHTKSRNPTPWGKILSSPAIWSLCGQQVCRGAGYMFFASWFPTFLQETRGVSVKDSGYLQAVVFTGTMLGCLCGGLLTDWIWKRTGSLRWSRSGVGATFLFACALLIFAAWFVESTALAVTLLAFGAFFAALAGPCAFSATMDLGGDYVPQVFGLMNMTGNLAAMACPILVAELFDRTENWSLVLLVFAGIYLVGAICWALVDCRKCIAHAHEEM